MEQEMSLDEALTALVFAKDFESYGRVLRAQQATLLSDEAEAMLEQMMEAFKMFGREAELPTLQTHQEMLLRCREVGIDAALAEMAAAEGLAVSPLEVAMQAFMAAETTAESRRVVEENEALLLSPEADVWLLAQIGYAEEDGNDELVAYLQEQREIMASLRAVGVAAFYGQMENAMSKIFDLPGRFLAALDDTPAVQAELAADIQAIQEQTSAADPLLPFYQGLIDTLQGRNSRAAGLQLVADYRAFFDQLEAEFAEFNKD